MTVPIEHVKQRIVAWGAIEMQQALFGIIVGAVVFALALGVGRLFWRSSRPYFIGLTAMGLAVAIEVSFIAINAMFFQIPFAMRVSALRRGMLPTLRDWLVFGVAFSLLESVLKWLQVWMVIQANPSAPAWLIAGPLIPLTMHIGLSVLAALLMRGGWLGYAAFWVTAGLHVLNNWGAYEIMDETDIGRVAYLMAFQGLIVGICFIVILYVAVRVTTTPEHAKAPP